ncbi:uncharacterized protein LOC135156447 [Lytechinus pictus]|uniref:uncharacterized protein LOC135156447 n=1 Tax=Lytechinus pictus TaxID=7653 RepID=UPI0030BA1916
MNVLRDGGFRLHKWISSNPSVLQSIPEEERAKNIKGLDLNRDALPVERALGVTWDVEMDCLLYKFRPRDKPPTRRGILSIVSSIYDPLGYIIPFTLRAKIILQELTRLNLGWDEIIPVTEMEKWNEWLIDLPKMADFQVNRCVKPHNFGEVKEYEVHHFADASEMAYGVSSYLVLKNATGQSYSGLIIAKSHLAPLKRMTIPRLELMAAALAVKLDAFLRRELEIPIKRSVYWTDSTIVLQYIRNEDKRFHTFVANRIAAIRDQSVPSQWHYIKTQCNPADDVTRSMTADELKANSRWLVGPNFIQQNENEWPDDPTTTETVEENDPEVKRRKDTQVFTTDTDQSNTVDSLLTHYSSWHKLKVVVAWILRVRQHLLNKTKGQTCDERSSLDASDMSKAEEAIVRYIQQQTYSKEYKALQQSTAVQGDAAIQVANSSPLSKLNVQFTDGGLICVGGRLQNSPLDEQTKHPVILPPKHHVVKLLIQHYHSLSGHSGKEHVLSLLRERYWILKGRQAVRQVLHNCFTCRRLRASPVEQKMADLPSDRVLPSKPPFSYVGVDVFGPYMIKQGRNLIYFPPWSTRDYQVGQ